MNVHDTRLDANGNGVTFEESVELYPSLTDQLLAARMAWTGSTMENVKLKAKLKKEKKIFRQLWKGTKEVTAELDQKEAQLREAKTELDQKEAQLREAKTELEHIRTVAERRELQIRGLRKDVDALLEEKKKDQEIDWRTNYYNETDQSQLLAEQNLVLEEKVAQLEKDLKDSREDNVMFPKGTLVIFPAGSELRFL